MRSVLATISVFAATTILAPPTAESLTLVTPSDGTYRIAVGKGPEGIAAGDVNSDGLTDLVVANRTSDSVSVLLGKPGGGFMEARTHGAPNNPVAVALSDLDRDGRTDLVVAALSDTVAVRLGRADGTLGASNQFGVGDAPTALVVADLDVDGVPDIQPRTAAATTCPSCSAKGRAASTRCRGSIRKPSRSPSPPEISTRMA